MSNTIQRTTRPRGKTRPSLLPKLVFFAIQIQCLTLLQLQFTQIIPFLSTCVPTVVVEAAHARKRPTVSNKKNNSSNKYDRQITTFDPNGQLLQVEYARECTKRGKTCAFVNYDDVIVAVIKRREDESGNDGNDENDDTVGDDDGMDGSDGGDDSNSILKRQRNRPIATTSVTTTPTAGMHRISDGILCKMTGLEGDGRLLARHLQSASHQLAWTEGSLSSSSSSSLPSIYVNQIAKLCGEVQHSLTIRSGARPLGVDAVLMGSMRKNNLGELGLGLGLGLFHCTVGGNFNQCEFCACGKDSNLVLQELDLFMNHELKERRSGNDSVEKEDSDEVSQEQGEDDLNEKKDKSMILQKLIKKVSHIVLNPTKRSMNAIGGDGGFLSTGHTGDDDTVDIYVIMANAKCRGGIQISCALCVPKTELDTVTQLFQEEYTL